MPAPNTTTSVELRSFRQACCSTVWELKAVSESSFDLQAWLQQHGVSAEQASGRLFCKWLPAISWSVCKPRPKAWRP